MEKIQKVLLTLMLITLFILFVVITITILKAYFVSKIKESSKGVADYVSKCPYPNKSYIEKNITTANKNGQSVTIPIRYEKEPSYEEVKQMIDWCCKNYNSNNIACELNKYVKR